MSTMALRRSVFAKSRRRVPVRDRMAKYVSQVYDEYGPEMICGILSMSGNKDSFRIYQLLKR